MNVVVRADAARVWSRRWESQSAADSNRLELTSERRWFVISGLSKRGATG